MNDRTMRIKWTFDGGNNSMKMYGGTVELYEENGMRDHAMKMDSGIRWI